MNMPTPIIPTLVFNASANSWEFADYPPTWSLADVPEYSNPAVSPFPVAFNLAVGETFQQKRLNYMRAAADRLRQGQVAFASGRDPVQAMAGGVGLPELFWFASGMLGPTAALYFGRLNAGEPVFDDTDLPPAPAPEPNPTAGAPADMNEVEVALAQFNAEIQRLIDTYRRPGVPDRYVMVDAFSTLAGWIVRAKAQANAWVAQWFDARRLILPPGSGMIPFPEAVGAYANMVAKNYPPPAGRIAVGVGDVPIGIPINPSFAYPVNYPWPAGAHSSWTPPEDAWNGTEGPAPAYRHPNPVLYWGPRVGGVDPNTGGTVTEEAPPTNAPYPDPDPAPPATDTTPTPGAPTSGLPPAPGGTPSGPGLPPTGGDGNGPLGPVTPLPAAPTPEVRPADRVPSLSPGMLVAVAAGVWLLFTSNRRR